MGLKEVDFFQHPRYSTNKLLLRCIGQWPYQNKKQRFLLYTATFISSLAGLPAQIAKVVINRTDWSIMIPTLGPIFVHLVCIVKVVNSIVCSDRMRLLLDRIRRDWQAQMGSEKGVLARYADDGRMYTLVYTAWLYISLLFYLIISIMPRVIVVNGWANLSSPTLYPIPVHFTSHDEDYYIYIETYLCSAIILMISIAVAVDGMFVVFIQHGCGIFAAIGYRLENTLVSKDLGIELHPSREADEPFWTVADCIKKHNEAIDDVILIYGENFTRYAALLDSAYSGSFLLLLGLNMLSISFTGLQVLWGATPEALDDAIRQGVFGGSQIMHLFFLSLFSQKLTDHSLKVFDSLHNSNWYKMSLRTRKLINLMLIRSLIPFELKAGRTYVMSIANFGAVLRTSLSYLTILSSME